MHWLICTAKVAVSLSLALSLCADTADLHRHGHRLIRINRISRRMRACVFAPNRNSVERERERERDARTRVTSSTRHYSPHYLK